MSTLVDLEVFLRQGAGRCKSCGFAIREQGHGTDCDRKRAPVARPKTAAPTPKPRRKRAWADREETTWIDRM